MRIGIRIRLTAAGARTAMLLLATGCAPAPLLLQEVPPLAGTFVLSDSGEVIRRVQQVFSCAAPANGLPYGILGWRRDSSFIDITMWQGLVPIGPDGRPTRMCWKGFRVDAEGRIFLLPLGHWPYTTFKKHPPLGWQI